MKEITLVRPLEGHVLKQHLVLSEKKWRSMAPIPTSICIHEDKVELWTTDGKVLLHTAMECSTKDDSTKDETEIMISLDKAPAVSKSNRYYGLEYQDGVIKFKGLGCADVLIGACEKDSTLKGMSDLLKNVREELKKPDEFTVFESKRQMLVCDYHKLGITGWAKSVQKAANFPHGPYYCSTSSDGVTQESLLMALKVE